MCLSCGRPLVQLQHKKKFFLKKALPSKPSPEFKPQYCKKKKKAIGEFISFDTNSFASLLFEQVGTHRALGLFLVSGFVVLLPCEARPQLI
jgi:hypothetical protein